MMASLYQDRLNKLVYGYNNQIVDLPNDVSKCILAFTQKKKELILNQVKSTTMTKLNKSNMVNFQWFIICSLEIYLDEFTAKVIDYSNNIDKYRVEYKCNNSTSTIDSSCTNKIGEQGLAFITLQTHLTDFNAESTDSYRVHAVNANNNCILQSQWMTYNRNFGSVAWAKQNIAYKYFKENIDINGKGYVNINEWIDALTKIEGFDGFNVWEMKRIFHFVMHLRKNMLDTNHMEVMKQMDKQDFYEFVRKDADKYNAIYKRFIDVLQDKNPNLFDDDDF